MRYEPYEYQQRATRFVLDHPQSALLLDMGLGKSVITLTAIQRLLDDCEIEKVLVVAPKKVAETTWTTEASKWDHLKGLRVSKVMGNERQRMAALAEKADVYVIGRDSYVWLVDYYKGVFPFDMLVIDELTSFKNPKSRRFKAMKMSRPRFHRVVGLTGTPAPNGLIDLWGQMYCIDQGKRLGKSYSVYRETYFNSKIFNYVVTKCTVKPGCDAIIRDLISDICLTMQAKDYLQLPDMIVHTVEIDLSPMVKKKYECFERDRILDFIKETKDANQTIIANSAAGLMNKLSQFANGAMYDDEHNVVEIHDEKIDKLAEIIEEANGASILVFYQYKHDANRICKRFGGLRVKRYEGEAELAAWNKGKIDILLAHPASTAYGLNMQQGGHYIVWFGTGWDLELYQQANARLHRQGQQHPVVVYKLIGKGTVDEKSNRAIEGKGTRQQHLLDSLQELINKHNDV